MSKRSGGEKQEDIWIAQTELAVAPGHPFYKRLNELLEGAGFDEFVEGLCARFYHARLGRPSLRPGVYFRALRERIGFRSRLAGGRYDAQGHSSRAPLRRRAGSLNTVCSRRPMLRLRNRVHLRARFELSHGDARRMEEMKELLLILLGPKR